MAKRAPKIDPADVANVTEPSASTQAETIESLKQQLEERDKVIKSQGQQLAYFTTKLDAIVMILRSQ